MGAAGAPGLRAEARGDTGARGRSAGSSRAYDDGNKTEAALGGGLGGAGGALAGQALGGETGQLVGAGVGAALGGALGANMGDSGDKDKEEEYQKALYLQQQQKQQQHKQQQHKQHKQQQNHHKHNDKKYDDAKQKDNHDKWTNMATANTKARKTQKTQGLNLLYASGQKSGGYNLAFLLSAILSLQPRIMITALFPAR
ncbi:MAG: hypothetical protein IPK95_07110 [Cellvibrionales bacterium]|nr:hypothetical protein [Cellvibrionales bacterium]